MSAGGHLKQEEMLAVAAPVSEGNGPSLIGANCFKINVDGESSASLVCLHDETKREKKCDSDRCLRNVAKWLLLTDTVGVTGVCSMPVVVGKGTYRITG